MTAYADDRGFWLLGRIFGGLVGLITFIGVWVATVHSWGWILGIAFGWLPSAIIAALAGLLAWAAWPLVVLVAFGALLWWGYGGRG